jgi:hypothetical protein
MTAVAPPLERIAPKLVSRLPAGALAGQAKGWTAAGAVLLVASLAIGFATDRTRFLHAYLTAYVWALGIVLGALFFVIVQHVTRAGWSVVVRRIAEHVAGTVPVMAALFLPIGIFYGDLYHHWAHPAPGDTVLEGKSGYLSAGFWFVRAAVYFVIWIWLARTFKKGSLAQDQSGDPAITLRLARLGAPGLLLYALSITFAAIDWIMSLDPHWFSTIFGVCYFAGGFMACMATLTLLSLWLSKRGLLADAITTEHYHDMGKLMFAFMVFWAYTNFSQYMLIWYANLPEETAFYLHRQHGNWHTMGAVLVIGHFLVPFAFLMSRHVKRNRLTLALGAVFMLVMHWIDMVFLVMPSYQGHGAHGDAGMHWTLVDFTCLFGFAALLAGLTVVSRRKAPLVPERDPRLAESLHFHNV